MHELNHQRHDVAQSFVEFHVTHHEAADALKKPQLLLNAFELLLEFPDSAGHDLIMAQLPHTAGSVLRDANPSDEKKYVRRCTPPVASAFRWFIV